MKHSNPDKPATDKKISDTDSNSHRKIINTDVSKMISQEQKEQSKNDRHITYERTNNRILAGILVVTFVYAVFSGLQWNIMRSSMKLEQRAWVGITHIVATGEIGRPQTITVGLKNTGKTVAQNVTTLMCINAIDLDTDPDFTKLKRKETDSKMPIAPQQEFTIIYDVTEHIGPISDIQTEQIIFGKMRVVFYGLIDYEDIFGVHHWLKYCGYLKGDGKTFNYYHKDNKTNND